MVTFDQLEPDYDALSLCDLAHPQQLIDLLNQNKKSDAVKAAKKLIVSEENLSALIYHSRDLGYTYKMLRWVRTPEDLQPLPTSHLNVHGSELGTRFSEFHGRLRQLRQDGRHLIAHLFTSLTDFCVVRNQQGGTPSFKWHVFYSDLFSELTARHADSHYKDGSHMHYASHLWNIARTEVVSRLALPDTGRNEGLPGSIHIRFHSLLEDENC